MAHPNGRQKPRTAGKDQKLILSRQELECKGKIRGRIPPAATRSFIGPVPRRTKKQRLEPGQNSPEESRGHWPLSRIRFDPAQSAFNIPSGSKTVEFFL
jgi:hypothetical protein